MPFESEIISRLKSRAKANDRVSVGIGDDAAVIKTNGGRDLVACCDLMVEGIHFRTEWTTPRLLGRKALVVNLSDVAAMGAVPKFAMVSIAVPPTCSSAFIDEVFEGIFESANDFGVVIIGGDTSASRNSLFIDVSMIGECETGRAVTRRGARIGDTIYISGSLGASAFGIALLGDGHRLKESKDPAPEITHQAILKHLSPEPRLKLGAAIGEGRLATSMIDISDGLSTDLWHILDESDCGAVIHTDAIPIAECVRSAASSTAGLNALKFALDSGEEYELLFTARPEDQESLAALSIACGLDITAVGKIVEGRQLQLERDGKLESIQPSGYEHLI